MDQIGQMMIAVVNKNVIISQAGVHLKRVFEIVDLEGEEYDGTGAGTGDDPALRTDEGQIARTCDDHFLHLIIHCGGESPAPRRIPEHMHLCKPTPFR